MRALPHLTRGRVALLSVVAGVCGSLAAADGRAAVIYNTFGDGNSYDGGNPIVISSGGSFFGQNYGFSWLAVPFTAPYNCSLNSVSLSTYYYANTNAMTVQIMADTGSGLPGTTLETINSGFGVPPAVLTFEGPTTYTPTVETSLTNPVLTAGQTYWVSVGAIGDGLGIWNANNQGITASIAHYGGSSFYGWEHSGTLTIPAMSVDVTPLPEPAAMAALGLSLFTLTRRRR